MKYDFDRVIDRRNTNSYKWDMAEKRGKPADVLPMWVADMDFECPREVADEAVRIAKRGIFGYSFAADDYFDILQGHLSDKFGYKPEKEWWLQCFGVMPAVALAVQAFTTEDEGVIYLSPVYHSFRWAVEDSHRNLVISSLKEKNGRWNIDFEDFERKIAENNVKAFLLCNPHNPVSRVWSREELLKLVEICRKHGVYIISDDIHAEFVFKGRHIMLPTLTDYDKIVLCFSPCKTFNISGLQIAEVFISNGEMREKFAAKLDEIHFWVGNMFGLELARAAYLHGGEWQEQLHEYLQGNIDFLTEFVKEQMPKAKLTQIEATYLAFLDLRAYGLSDGDMDGLLSDKAKVWTNPGGMFGAEGEGFVRINFATQRSVLKEAMERVGGVLEGL